MFTQNEISLKTQMRVIGKSWGWLWEEKHFDSTLGSTSTVIWTLPLTDSKTNIVLCLVGCTCTMTSLRETDSVRPRKPLVLIKKRTIRWLLRTPVPQRILLEEVRFIKHFIRMIFFVSKRRTKVTSAKVLDLLFLQFKQFTHLGEASVHAIAYSGHQCTDKCQ